MWKERIISYNNIDLDHIDTRGIVIGDEGCIYSAIRLEHETILKAAAIKGISVRYLTPIVPDKYIEDLYTHIYKLSSINSIVLCYVRKGWKIFNLCSGCKSHKIFIA